MDGTKKKEKGTITTGAKICDNIHFFAMSDFYITGRESSRRRSLLGRAVIRSSESGWSAGLSVVQFVLLFLFITYFSSFTVTHAVNNIFSM